MKDKDGFTVKCVHSDWKIIDDRDNHDFICLRLIMSGNHYCYGDELCRYYVPEGQGESDDE